MGGGGWGAEMWEGVSRGGQEGEVMWKGGVSQTDADKA